MAFSGTRYFAFGSRAQPRTRDQRLARLDRFATLLDTAFMIPFTRIRFGVDGILGLVPGLGDLVTALMSFWIVYEGHRLGAPRHVLLRMMGNLVLDVVLGAVPVAGDIFDIFWRANRRNIRILREHFSKV